MSGDCDLCGSYDHVESNCPQLFNLYQEAQAEIDRLKAERRWIPVKNRHPEHGERVFVKMRNGWVGAANYANIKENAYRWMNTDGKGYLFEVTHWMPLPPPPEGEEK